MVQDDQHRDSAAEDIFGVNDGVAVNRHRRGTSLRVLQVCPKPSEFLLRKRLRGAEPVTAPLRQAHDRAFRADPLQILGIAAFDRFGPLKADWNAPAIAHLERVVRGIEAFDQQAERFWLPLRIELAAPLGAQLFKEWPVFLIADHRIDDAAGQVDQEVAAMRHAYHRRPISVIRRGCMPQ